MQETTYGQGESLPATLLHAIEQAIEKNGGWLPFDTFMQMALYLPQWGYYSSARRKIGRMPAGALSSDGAVRGSDFATAPEISALFGRSVAVQIGEALRHSGTNIVYEFGAGNGTLAYDVLQTLGPAVQRYCIVDVSGVLRERQAVRLAQFGAQVRWLNELPPTIEGVLLGNEVLDAMPVKLVHHCNGHWHERGVVCAANGQLGWLDRPSDLQPSLSMALPPDASYTTEIHPWAEAFIRTTSERLRRGAALWIDYGFGESEYYHPQRHMGTLVAHHQHQMDERVLELVGEKDLTSHINFTGIAVAAQQAGLEVLGYTSQARFLINCGVQALLDGADLKERHMAAKLLHEHEMGELFKVMMLGPAPFWEPLGFSQGDRTHLL